jgi:hypothetical protein
MKNIYGVLDSKNDDLNLFLKLLNLDNDTLMNSKNEFSNLSFYKIILKIKNISLF